MGEDGGNQATQRAITDPLWEVIHECGPHHARADEQVEAFAERLRTTGRDGAARELEFTRSIVPGDDDASLVGQNVC